MNIHLKISQWSQKQNLNHSKATAIVNLVDQPKATATGHNTTNQLQSSWKTLSSLIYAFFYRLNCQFFRFLLDHLVHFYVQFPVEPVQLVGPVFKNRRRKAQRSKRFKQLSPSISLYHLLNFMSESLIPKKKILDLGFEFWNWWNLNLGYVS